jgi:hypothetical protein
MLGGENYFVVAVNPQVIISLCQSFCRANTIFAFEKTRARKLTAKLAFTVPARFGMYVSKIHLDSFKSIHVNACHFILYEQYTA